MHRSTITSKSSPGAGPELEHAHAALGSVPEGHEAHPRDRVEPAQPAGKLAARERTAMDVRHRFSLPAGTSAAAPA